LLRFSIPRRHPPLRAVGPALVGSGLRPQRDPHPPHSGARRHADGNDEDGSRAARHSDVSCAARNVTGVACPLPKAWQGVAPRLSRPRTAAAVAEAEARRRWTPPISELPEAVLGTSVQGAEA